MIKILVNGKEYSFENSLSLDDLLTSLNLNKDFLAVAINLQVIPKSNYSQTKIENNDKVEIMHGVGGG